MEDQTLEKVVFISYCWKDTPAKDQLYEGLRTMGIMPSVDIISIDNWGSISDFMSSVNQHHFVVVLLSESYLKSQSCMKELDAAMQMPDYYNRVLPIILDQSLFNLESKTEYVRYWCTKRDEYIRKAAEENGSIRKSYIEQYEVANRISDNLLSYLDRITDMKCPSKEVALDWVASRLKDMGVDVLDIESTYLITEKTTVSEISIASSENICNRKNELINWYFANPVNQRGAACYSRGYTIDRWSVITQNITACVELFDIGLKCSIGEIIEKGKPYISLLEQKIENAVRFSDKDVTFSIYVTELFSAEVNLQIAYKTGNDKMITVANKAINTIGLHSVTVHLACNLKLLSVRIIFSSYQAHTPAFVILKSSKLEFGKESSLQRDEPPIFHEELLRCQRYTLKINKGIVAWPSHIGPYTIDYSIPVTNILRIVPSIYTDKYRLYNKQTGEYFETYLKFSGVQGSALHLSAFTADRQIGNFALAAIEDTVFDAELY